MFFIRIIKDFSKVLFVWLDEFGREYEDKFVWIWRDKCVYFFQ